MSPSKVAIWDAPVRVLHWMQATLVAIAWWTGSMIGPLHEYVGFAVGALLAARVAWGMAGRGHARFASFVRSRRYTVEYARAVLAGRAARHLGHNPLGAWMIVWLLGCIAAVVVTGWLYTTDWLWGYGWLADLHAALAWVLVASVAVHVTGVLLMSWRHRENLVGAMITGRKRPAADDDVA